MESNLVLIKSYNNEIEAKMIAQILNENGIEVMIHKDDSGSMRPHFQKVLGVQLFVKREYLERAEEIIMKFEKIS